MGTDEKAILAFLESLDGRLGRIEAALGQIQASQVTRKECEARHRRGGDLVFRVLVGGAALGSLVTSIVTLATR
jgi:hypothetical protein